MRLRSRCPAWRAHSSTRTRAIRSGRRRGGGEVAGILQLLGRTRLRGLAHLRLRRSAWHVARCDYWRSARIRVCAEQGRAAHQSSSSSHFSRLPAREWSSCTSRGSQQRLLRPASEQLAVAFHEGCKLEPGKFVSSLVGAASPHANHGRRVEASESITMTAW